MLGGDLAGSQSCQRPLTHRDCRNTTQSSHLATYKFGLSWAKKCALSEFLLNFYQASQRKKMATFGWIALGVLVMATAWLWKRYTLFKALGLSDGRKFGNQIADAMELEYNLFHTILEAGDTPVPSLMMLDAMRKAKVMPMDAAVDIAPFLLDGLRKLENRWGPQPQLKEATPSIYRIVEIYESKHQ